MDNELDPAIAKLLADAAATQNTPDVDISFPTADPQVPVEQPEQTPAQDNDSEEKDTLKVDLTRKQFTPIEKFFSDQKNSVFSDPQYYKSALSGEKEASQKLHNILSKYLTCTDSKDKTVYRQQIVNIYWEFLRSLAPKMSDYTIPLPKRMLMRFAVVLPTLFTPEQKDMFSSAFIENTYEEPVFYLDEWFEWLGTGRLTLSATDEARPQKKTGTGSEEAKRLMQLQSKNMGKLQTSENLLSAKESERTMIETDIKMKLKSLFDHPSIPGLEPHTSPYSESQKKIITDINEKLRQLLKVDRDLHSNLADYKEAKEIGDNLKHKIATNPDAADIVNSADINTEVDTVRQMAKMTVGRQGNHFPIFTKEFFHCIPRQTGFRENVIDMLAWVESIDPGAFCRIHKNMLNRIVPYVVLVPTYGDTGFCWEPFDRYNRVTSRGRIVVPMYPKNLQIAVLTAVADLRWQVAKEKASYYWMEEGLTGQYYQWIDSQKLKGDLKEFFINDYVLWMTKESEGVQRLDKEVRGIFWRHMPFPQELKDKLKTRSLVYQELCQRDLNRSMSDGY
ncbi:MAG: hypothetical protein K5930_02190 [Treponemataceae bacterium]|nr:hypothetical protein [Treponemataceae bacterium]